MKSADVKKAPQFYFTNCGAERGLRKK